MYSHATLHDAKELDGAVRQFLLSGRAWNTLSTVSQVWQVGWVRCHHHRAEYLTLLE